MSSLRSSGNSTPTSPHPVLPPIVRNDKDRRFLQELNGFIKQEMASIDDLDCHQRYAVFKSAFDQIIDYVHAYKPLLNAVKAEYEDFIETIKRGRREADYLSGKLQTMAAEPSTLRNYKKRREDLEKKLQVIHNDNSKLTAQLESLREKRRDIEAKHKTAETVVVKQVAKKDPRRIPGLTLEQATNPDVLVGEFHKLDDQLRDLNDTWSMRYRPKNRKEQLKEILDEKVEMKDKLMDEGETLKERRQRLRVALEAANKYKDAPPFNKTIGDSVADSFKQTNTETQSNKQDTSILPFPQESTATTFEDDDPTKEREADMMLEYIAKFNELFNEGKYEEAAIHAANSPKGILRNMETLNKFKSIGDGDGRSPLLAFCDALMSSVLALGVRPSKTMSTECVKCALSENRLDLLSHWISQDRLTVTETLGDLIVEYCMKHKSKTYLALAENIYIQVNAHMKTVRVLIQQGRVKRALEYTLRGDTPLERNTWLQLLQDFPSPQLAEAITEKHPQLNNTRILPVGVVVGKFLQMDQINLGLNLLQHFFVQKPQQGEPVEPTLLRKAIFEDDETSLDQWHDIVKQCQDTGYEEIALEVLAAVTVLRVMQSTTLEDTRTVSLGVDGSGQYPADHAVGMDSSLLDPGESSDTTPPATTESERVALRGDHDEDDDDNEDENDDDDDDDELLDSDNEES